MCVYIDMNYVLDTKFKFTIMNIHGHAQAEDRLQTNSTKLRAAIGLLCSYSLLLLFFGLGLVLSGCVSTGVIFLALL